MRKKFIKRAIPAEISGKGGGYIQFVEKDTVPLDGVIVDAIDGSYCQGRPTLILSAIQGLLKSMARGVATDGHPRQVADYITVYLVVDGEIDLDRGFDPAVNSLKIRARLLNEMEIDITGWALEDVTPGRRSFTLASAYTGATKGAWEIGEAGEINGDNVPNTKTGEAIRIDWAVEGTDKSGTIDADKVTSNISRIDIAADALDELKDEQYNGKTVVFTVRGNFSSAKISATLKYVAPKPRVTIGSLAAVMEDADNARITLDNLANFEAIRGYAENPGGTPTFTAKLYRNGTYLKDVTFNVYDPDIKGLSECETTGFTPDEELKVVLEVDPEKTEYDPTPAEATCTVTA